VDGAFVQASRARKRGWGGFVCRDHTGDGVLAGAGKLWAVHDALMAEAIAC
jgi:hypothetical protein